METTDNMGLSRARLLTLARLFDWGVGCALALGLLAGLLGYLAPPRASLAVGWLGDRLFLPASEGLGAREAEAGRWFSDELTDDAPTHRSRWMRQRALVRLPGLGAAGQADLTLVAQGWPANALRGPGAPAQPTVEVLVNGVSAGSIQPTPQWAEHRVAIPPAALSGGDLQIELRSPDYFTDTSDGEDVRQKVLRVASLRVAGVSSRPAAAPLVLLALGVALGYAALARASRRRWAGLAGAGALAALGGLALALARVWAAALLPWAAGLLALALLVVYWRAVWPPLRGFMARLARPAALDAGMAAALCGWLLYGGLRAAALARSGAGPAELCFWLAALLLAAWAFVPRALLLPRAAQGLGRALGGRRGALLVLGFVLAGCLGYEAYLIFTMPGVGHADYADNAVVARNLVRGRGWVVDYVTQFYKLYPSLTRPQETWSLMQPVWIAPFFLLFGAVDWAAKLPNLLFTAALGVLVYRFGARAWDRRVGLLAAALLVTSNLFLLLVINATTDLPFVLFSFAALGMVYWRGQRMRAGQEAPRPLWQRLGGWWSLGLGLLTGLMFLQKTSNGVFMAAGMGLWMLAMLWRGRGDRRWAALLPRLLPLAVWTAVALCMLAPYLMRNLALSRASGGIYGSLIYSTESRDAWVWKYAPNSDWIYKIYTDEAGLSETQGLPDRSWLLRWGFDRALATVVGDPGLAAVRNYLLPPWYGMPAGLGDLLSGPSGGPTAARPNLDDKRLFSAMGAWLAALGLLAALRRRADLAGLLALGFAPYTAFLILYWHADEERYFVALMPWLALAIALAVWRIYDRVASWRGGRLAPLALALSAALVAQIVVPSWSLTQVKLHQWTYADGDRDAYAWIREHTPPDAVLMTRVPWQVNWYTERPTVMIPFTEDTTKLLQIARHYRVRYLVMDVAQRPEPATQQKLEQLFADPALLRYATPRYEKGSTLVYEFPADYGNVPELRP
ncbi:glycosyltransferase family 39 protein [Chloroflexia bacterium SDU3-3]|nr:glycosyltransferase family 39 protein [Chloroflexia bacterium SDU3-3]